MFCKKRCSWKFNKIHRKTPVSESLFSCEFCKISKNTLFTEHLWETTSDFLSFKNSLWNKSNDLSFVSFNNAWMASFAVTCLSVANTVAFYNVWLRLSIWPRSHSPKEHQERKENICIIAWTPPFLVFISILCKISKDPSHRRITFWKLRVKSNGWGKKYAQYLFYSWFFPNLFLLHITFKGHF